LGGESGVFGARFEGFRGGEEGEKGGEEKDRGEHGDDEVNSVGSKEEVDEGKGCCDFGFVDGDEQYLI
jgi:hypothetical protein